MKPKREITLGEMQDECSFRGGNCQTISCATVGGDMCVHYKICGKIGKPIDWDLSDSPRFTEAQMALLKALWDNGVVKLERWNKYDSSYYAESAKYGTTSLLTCDWFGETVWKIDLAELFGKEGK